jgi:hypothetical protein
MSDCSKTKLAITVIACLLISGLLSFFVYKLSKPKPLTCAAYEECVDLDNLCGDENKQCWTSLDINPCGVGQACVTPEGKCASPLKCGPKCSMGPCPKCPTITKYRIRPIYAPANYYVGYNKNKPTNCPAGINAFDTTNTTVEVKYDWIINPIVNKNNTIVNMIQLDDSSQTKPKCLSYGPAGNSVSLNDCDNSDLGQQWVIFWDSGRLMLQNISLSQEDTPVEWLTYQPNQGTKCALHFSNHMGNEQNAFVIIPAST